MKSQQKKTKGKPRWLKRRLPTAHEYESVKQMIARSNLHTVCQEANCPNQWECFSNKSATFMILGASCTRNCRFCNVTQGIPLPPDPDEPLRVARAVKELGLSYVVVTSITRDDLEDGGAAHFARTIAAIKKSVPDISGVEVLIPDLKGDIDALNTILKAGPAVLNHNIETVPSLYSRVRPEADYQRSLALLKRAAESDGTMAVKSGIMVGLGENVFQIEETLADIYQTGCTLVTIGQYLQPSKEHLEVARYYTPEEFEDLKTLALSMGFSRVASGPLVRSSYGAETLSGIQQS